jgi:hypothetical protein
MANRLQVTCHKPDNLDVDRRIQGIGGNNGKPWYLPIDRAISSIENGEWEFFVRVNNREVLVVVRIRPNGRKFLTTAADGHPPNNLLNLPVCP